jgi:hypothetical protein
VQSWMKRMAALLLLVTGMQLPVLAGHFAWHAGVDSRGAPASAWHADPARAEAPSVDEADCVLCRGFAQLAVPGASAPRALVHPWSGSGPSATLDRLSAGFLLLPPVRGPPAFLGPSA